MIDCDNCTHNLVCNREQHLKEECIFFEEPRPHGEWIPLKNKKGEIVAFRCSTCGQSPKYAVNSDFCPRCGSDNRKRKG